NLVGNAIKFTDRGKVVVSAEPVTEGWLRLSVADTGAGIAREQQAKIFERFVQSDSGASSPQGSGLGLAIAARLTTLMGGGIWVESEPGAGSTFHLVVQMHGARAGTSPSPIGRALRILHVDDAEDSRAILAAYLQGTAHTLDGVATSAAALGRLRAERYDLVLVDLRLGGEDGLELVRRQRAREAEQRLEPSAIVALTADDRAASRRLAIEAGVSGYLLKPLGRAAFLDFL